MSKKPRILAVDDEPRNLRLIEGLLTPLGYEVLQATNGQEALDVIQKTPPDVILLDVLMPKVDGFEVARRLKSDEATKIIPIVMVTSLSATEDRVRALEVGADDFLSKPLDKTELRARVQSLVKVKAYNDHMVNYQKELEEAVAQRTQELQEAFVRVKAASLETILRLSRAAEFKDEDTGAHILRMSHYAAAVARKMGLPEEDVETILYAAPMHDVGKIGIPDHILLKPGKLDADEWRIMKAHATMGVRILEGSDADVVKMGEIIAGTHHEKWNGEGYPLGLEGENIPLSGRISAIADVFDALTSRRPYKEAFPLDRSFSIIAEERGTHFDPAVVDAFFAIEAEILEIKEQYRDEGKSHLARLLLEREPDS